MTFHDPREVRKQRAAAPVFLVFGLLFLVLGFLSGREPLRLKREGVSAPGTVIKLVAGVTSNGGSAKHAVVRFTAADGALIQFQDRMGSNPPMYRAGEPVRVLYRPDAPARSAIVDRGFWNLAPAFFLAIMGLVLGAVGVSMRLQPPPTGEVAAPVPATAPVPRDAASDAGTSVAQTTQGSKHALLWTLALSAVAVALIVAPPNHKTGDAALGVLLCVMAGLVAALRAIVNIAANVFFAGFGAVVATRSGAARGLDVDGPAAAWAACADDSPRLRSLRLRYTHFRRALWATGMVMLLGGITLMGLNLLTRAGAGT
jgi:hypothetical protein